MYDDKFLNFFDKEKQLKIYVGIHFSENRGKCLLEWPPTTLFFSLMNALMSTYTQTWAFNRRKNNVVFNFKKGFVFKKYVKTKMAFSRSFQSSINFSKRAECLFL